jgi:hypothetical protein
MKNISLIFLLCTIFSASTVFALTPTPTPTPSACQNLQACVSSGVSATLTSCIADNSACTFKKPGKFAVSASDLSERSIVSSKCRNKTKKSACNLCYNLAKIPLKSRYDGSLFHGLLAQAVSIIESERKSRCSGL